MLLQQAAQAVQAVQACILKVLDLYGEYPYTECRRGTMSRAATTKKTRFPASRTKMYRFDARLNHDQKLLIQRAADLEGRTMTDFVLHSAQAAAERTLQDRALLILTARETETFVNAILNPPEPGPVLREAVRNYKNQIGAK